MKTQQPSIKSLIIVLMHRILAHYDRKTPEQRSENYEQITMEEKQGSPRAKNSKSRNPHKNTLFFTHSKFLRCHFWGYSKEKRLKIPKYDILLCMCKTFLNESTVVHSSHQLENWCTFVLQHNSSKSIQLRTSISMISKREARTRAHRSNTNRCNHECKG